MPFLDQIHHFSKCLILLISVTSISFLQACGGGGGDVGDVGGEDRGGAEPIELFTISGTVTGLDGSGLVLQNNSSDDLDIPINTDGHFIFPEKTSNNVSYNISVLSQPSDSNQICTVSRGSGTVSGADITDISVTCVATYTLSGTVTGLTGSGLIVQNNFGDDLEVDANGHFTFNTEFLDNSQYSITVLSFPNSPNQICTVSNASGKVSSINITDISVACVDSYSVSVNVTGLNGAGLVLQNNNGDDLNITLNGTMSFAATLLSNTSYSVSVLNHPSNVSQLCTISNGEGIISGAAVNDINISCENNTFSIGGTVSGLAGSGLVLQNNGNDSLTVNSNGIFTFTNNIVDGTSYAVTVLTQPSSLNQVCSVTNGSGRSAGSDISTVAIDCKTNTYTVGGIVSGYEDTNIMLQNNAGDELTVNGNGAFKFSTALTDGSDYSVALVSTGSAQRCSVNNGSGTLNGTEVTNVSVVCVVPAEIISGPTYSKLLPPSILSYSGGTLMTWKEDNGVNQTRLYRYKNDSELNWSQPQPIDDITGSARLISDGNIVMLVDDTRVSLQYMTFDGVAWSALQAISMPDNMTSNITIGLDTNSTSIAWAMSMYDSSYNGFAFVFKYENSQWSTSPPLSFASVSSATDLEMLHNDGGTLVSWTESSSAKPLSTAIYDDLSWSDVQQVHEPTNANPIRNYKVKESDNNFAFFWTQRVGVDAADSPVNLYSSVVNPDTSSWSTVETINTLTANEHVYEATSNGVGFGVVWSEDVDETAASQHNVFSRLFTTTWSAPEQLSTVFPVSYWVDKLQMVSNGTGYAAAWQYHSGDAVGATTFGFYGAIHNGTNWLATSKLGTGAGFTNARPQLMLVSDGQTYAANWTDYQDAKNRNGVNIYASVSSAIDNSWPVAPTLLKSDTDRLINPILTTGTGYRTLWFENEGKGLAYYSKAFRNFEWESAPSLYLAPVTLGSSFAPHIARNSTGTSVAVWYQFDLHMWRYFMSSNTGGGWTPALNIAECNYQTARRNAGIKIESNGSDFMILCNSRTPSGFSQSYVAAIPFDGLTLSAASRLQQFKDYNIASNGNGFAISYQRNGTYSGSKGQYIQVFDSASQEWGSETLLYEDITVLSQPAITSNGIDYAAAWSSRVSTTQTDAMTSVYNNSLLSWDTQTVDTISGVIAGSPVITGYTNNEYILSWTNDDSYYSVYSNDSWSTPALTGAEGLYSVSYAITHNAGDLGLIWGKSNNSITANIFTQGSWQQETVLTASSSQYNNNQSIASNGSDYAVIWYEDATVGRSLISRAYRDGIWGDKETLDVNIEINDKPVLFATDAGFRALWSAHDPSDLIDKRSHRIWITEEY